MTSFKRYFTLTTCLLMTTFSYTQNEIIITGKIINENNEPLPYVNIGVVDTPLGTISSLNGNFKLYLNEEIAQQSIVRFSYLGYETQDFTIEKLLQSENMLIILKEDAFTLSMIEVRSEPTRFKTVGTTRTNTKMFTNFAINRQPNQNLGASVGRRFKIGKKNAFLENFRFFINSNNYDTIRFRVNIFSVKKGRPEKNLNSNDLIITIKDRAKGWVEVDLKSQNIRLEEDVIVTLEWIYHGEKGGILSLPMNIPSFATHLYKYGSQDKWKIFRGMSTAMELTYSY